jgi:hypothetical protein
LAVAEVVVVLVLAVAVAVMLLGGFLQHQLA